MSHTSSKTTDESLFGDVIYTYTRAQAIEDGVLIDPGSMAKEAGFKWPVVLTAGAWEDCVTWTDDDSQQQKIHQDQSGRLWDVLYMASFAVRANKDSGDRILFELYRVPKDGQSMDAELTTLKLIVGPGDSSEAVITILLPHED